MNQHGWLQLLPILVLAGLIACVSNDTHAADVKVKTASLNGAAPDAVQLLGTNSKAEVVSASWPYRSGYRSTVRYRPYSSVYRSRYSTRYFGYRPYYYGYSSYRPHYSYYLPSYTSAYRYSYRPYSYSRLWYSPYTVGYSNIYRPYYSYPPSFYTYRPYYYSAPVLSTTVVAPVGYQTRTYYHPTSFAPVAPIGVTYGLFGYSTIGSCCY